jgi:DNA-3-methyladenine glycosylase II
MPAATRSSGRAAAPTLKRAITPPSQPQQLPPTPRSPPAKRQKTAPVAAAASSGTRLPATLTFNFENAKQHLIDLDVRFERIFRAVKCRPFEELEEIDPFRLVHTFGLY